jgi:hypothetical protein
LAIWIRPAAPSKKQTTLVRISYRGARLTYRFFVRRICTSPTTACLGLTFANHTAVQANLLGRPKPRIGEILLSDLQGDRIRQPLQDEIKYPALWRDFRRGRFVYGLYDAIVRIVQEVPHSPVDRRHDHVIKGDDAAIFEYLIHIEEIE